MRWLVGFFITISILVVLGYIVLTGYPYYMYSGWANGKRPNKYYAISHYKKLYLAPQGIEELDPYEENYAQLWRNFPIRNALVPLPTRHPLFQTIPIIESKTKTDIPQVGIIITGPSNREVSRIYTQPESLYPDHSQGQELFKFPYFRNKLKKYSLDQVWKDLFSRKIVIESKSLDEMVYDLYILHLRSKLFPPQTKSYGLIKDGKQAVIELDSKDQDYKIELIMSQESGSIYSYVLRTQLGYEDSRKLRLKFLYEVSFSPMDESMARILYTEFKQLNFARQIDQEGMEYLFSSWTQDLTKVEMLKELIFYMERGGRNSLQLKPFYTYAFMRYGKTFTTRSSFTGNEDPEVLLQRKIEIESNEKMQELAREKIKETPQPDLSPDERMNSYLKKAKDSPTESTDDTVIH
jgi:hypothetical protein